ncbi:MAG: hypothetical protein VX313_01955 [Bacteroidota bacterium]|nr:hypothetical protein [Bacteroidota bacterium]MEC7616849.1 hypothetical protein [Bacteroidota bacterium]MEC7659621.1 hypothetical protein [Bacteroidota bacterium]MED5363373.1 hypothetical protein [Bacteroidota bacterium]MEE3019995.1 hypothetical protein [Bacteroidota bacterium]
MKIDREQLKAMYERYIESTNAPKQLQQNQAPQKQETRGRPKKHTATKTKSCRLPIDVIEAIETNRSAKCSFTDSLVSIVRAHVATTNAAKIVDTVGKRTITFEAE